MPSTVRTQFQRSVTIDRPAMDLYQYWHDFSHLPELMPYLERVVVLDEMRSHWIAKSKTEQRIEWDARVTEDEPGRVIAWESEPGAEFTTGGSIRFTPAPGNKGTEVALDMAYDPPAGALGKLVATLLGEEPGQVVTEGLRRLKRLMETGELPTTEGQPCGTCGRAAKEKKS